PSISPLFWIFCNKPACFSFRRVTEPKDRESAASLNIQATSRPTKEAKGVLAMNTFSKQLLASIVGVVVLASQAIVFAADPVGPSPKTTGVIAIAYLAADEAGKAIAPLANSGATPVPVTYTFSKWNGSA